ncbi:alpha,alpha-trehalose-phosphate synthase (UDP-forming) [Rhodoblastus sp.]|uniref:alpha,alpha-trehalose-phosphate synthase (UDP-forming) n=1 Tax=Rhodoblastus sp. TaxID=1962975 RepID=UPI003F9CE176
MSSRLIVVSNRVAAPDPGNRHTAGGLAVAVKAAMRNRTGVWFGWSGKINDDPAEEPLVQRCNKVDYAVIDLSEADFQEYYNGLANRVLWPILHYRGDLQEYSRADQTGYMRVNRLFAEKLSELIRDDDVIWVHDYHLMPLARELRARGHGNPIGFFLHIPCAPPDIVQTLPHHEDIFGALTYYDLVGFQTERDRDNFAHYLTPMGATLGRNPMTISVDGRQTRLGAFPVGIETAAFARLSRFSMHSRCVEDVRESLQGRKLVIGVDRLDYSKGILHRINAFDRFLDEHPEWRSKVVFLQITPRSRSDIKEYIAIEDEVTAMVGKINGRYGEADWTPLRYINRPYSRTVLAGLYRLADVALVTPLRDGMNLVAKEFVAAQDRADPGVLVLSEFAGASAELDRALIVNPHESEAVAAALKQALEMPLEERQRRHDPMMDHLLEYDIDHWAEEFLSALGETRHRSGLLESLRGLFAVSLGG